MCHQHAAGLADRTCNRLPVVRLQCAQIHQLHADSLLAFYALCRLQSARNHRAIGHHSQVAAFFPDPRLAKRNHEIRPGIRRPAKGLAIQPLVLQEQHRIIAADGGSQQPVGIQRVRGKADAQPGRVRENALAAL